METGDHFKNGASSKSQMSRRNIFQLVILSIVAMLVVSSCGKDNNTTYTFKYTADDVSGVTVNVIAFEYDKTGDVLEQQSFDKCMKGFSKVVTVNPKATKVKVKVTMKAGTNSLVMWVQEVFYLEVGKNVNIEMKGSTKIVEKEP